MGIRAAVVGASGYGGGELLRLLLGHPDIEIGPLLAGSQAGKPVGAVHPHLPALADRVFQATEPGVLAEAELVFFALPHGESGALATQLPDDVKVVDLGADFRIADEAAWARYYDTPYAGHWPYGLPELPGNREQITQASRVAAPGCYPTAVILALAPLLARGLVEPADIVVVAASGTSGAGRAARPNLLGSEVMGSMSPYGVGGVHRHTPEMAQALTAQAGTEVSLSFTPTLAPMPRGILATCTARVRPGVSALQLRGGLAESYAIEPFVHVLPEGSWPSTGATYGGNGAQLQVALDEHVGRAVVVSAIDNLGKGAAGQAIQSANLMLGLEETTGLTSLGVAP